MRKLFIHCACIVAFALTLGKAHAQTGIAINDNNATADPSAMLDVSVNAAAKKGFLLPRMTTTQRDAIASPAKGLLVYVTNVDSLEINVGTPASPKWFAFAVASTTVNGWMLTGNTGTNPATNFLGSADAADVAFRSNNTERMRILSNGNVGIGTTAPGYKLQVSAVANPLALSGVQVGAITDSVLTIDVTTGVVRRVSINRFTGWSYNGDAVTGVTKFGTTSAFDLPFITNNSENMRITSGGNIGIGTTTPTNKLQVTAASNPLALGGVQNGAIGDSLLSIDPVTGVVRRLSVNRFLGWSFGGNGVAANTNLGTTSNFDLPFITNNTEKVRITTSGNVGIGNAAAGTTRLQVTPAAGGDPLALSSVKSGVMTDSLLSIDPTTGVVRRLSVNRFLGWSYGGDAVAANTNLGTTSNFDLPFITNNIENMRITKAGNIGIGNSAPAQKLDVTGNVRFSGALMPNGNAGTAGYFLVSTGAGNAPIWFNANGYAWLMNGNVLPSAVDSSFGTKSNNSLPFITNNVERMRITNTGNVGIGTNAPTNKLQVSGTNPLALTGVQSGVMTDSILSIDASTGVVRWLSTSRLSGWSYGGDAVTGITKLGTTSAFDLPFITNNSENMRITSAGNVGIGTTGPTNKLTVAGTNPLALYGVQVGTQTANDSILTIKSGIVTKLPLSAVSDWDLAGNTGTTPGTNFLGTIDAKDMVFKTNNIENLRIMSGGNIGVGTSAPGNKMTIAGTNPLALYGVQVGTQTVNDSLLTIKSGIVTKLPLSALAGWTLSGNAGTTAGTNFIGTTDVKDLVFKTNNAEYMRMTTGGNVGIGSGTINPSNKLTVTGTNPLALYGLTTGAATDSILTIKNGVVQMVLPASSSSSNAWNLVGNAGTSPGAKFIGTTDNQSLMFKVNNTESGYIGTANDKVVSLGYQANRSSNSTAIGYSASVGNDGTAIGYDATSSNNFSTAVGSGATASAANTTAIGAGATASSNANATAIGSEAKATNGNATALGYNAAAVANSTSVGANASSTQFSVAVGYTANASGQYAVAIGQTSTASQEAVVIGYNATSGGNNEGVAIGSTSTSGYQGVSVGKLSSSAQGSEAFGYNAKATGYQSMSFGFNSSAASQGAVAIGTSASSSSANSIALGINAKVQTGFYNSIAIGNGAVTANSNSVAIGNGATASNINSMALGNGATVSNDNTIVIGSGTTAVLFNNGAYVAGRTLIVGSGPSNGNGAYLTTGGTWTNTSDKNLKEEFTKVDGSALLSKIVNMDLTKWRYKGTNEYHIGPMAQDFYAAFKLGTDDKHISTIDPAGVALVAIQELKKENDVLTKKLDDQQKLLEQLLKEVSELKAKSK